MRNSKQLSATKSIKPCRWTRAALSRLTAAVTSQSFSKPWSMSRSASLPVPSRDTCPIEGNGPDGPLVIEPTFSRIEAARTLLLAVLILNSLGLAAIVMVIIRGRISLDEILKLMFSLAVCVACDLWAVYLVLKCFNPKPTLVLSQRNLYPGDEFEISWMFKGRTKSIRKLKISLLGKESVKYLDGTVERTEEAVFVEHVLMETENPEQIASGFTLVQLPADAMHSFKSANYEIFWIVQLHGVVNWWPKLNDSFPIRVLTLPVREASHA
jgi:hypothetical protein